MGRTDRYRPVKTPPGRRKLGAIQKEPSALRRQEVHRSAGR